MRKKGLQPATSLAQQVEAVCQVYPLRSLVNNPEKRGEKYGTGFNSKIAWLPGDRMNEQKQLQVEHK